MTVAMTLLTETGLGYRASSLVRAHRAMIPRGTRKSKLLTSEERAT